MFSYPLSAEEIKLFLDRTVCPDQLEYLLEEMVMDRVIFRFDNLYVVRNEASLVLRRRNGNSRAIPLLQKARKISKFLYWFPYVRGIGISGSLSKNYADENTDIDFFIITRVNRLWIARTCMHLFKKLTFLVGRQHWFCMNYYVDEYAMQVHEQNIFTATEVVTLVPVHGNGVLTNFFNANNWVKEYFPNHPPKTGTPVKPKETFIKRSIEYCLNGPFGEKLDNYLMRITTRRWKQKEQVSKLNVRGERMGLSTGKHFAKPNPDFFQQKVLSKYQRRLNELL
jgi:predicted nucleotidyltransferase